jgi:hypothetical protein
LSIIISTILLLFSSDLSYMMADSLDVTVEEARRIVLDIGRRKGYLPPQHRLTHDKEALEIIQSIREELGDVVESYA